MLSNSIFPADLWDLAQQVIEQNAARGRTIALAESCTGGLVAAALTEVPGSSAVLDRGFVTYSNEAKTEMLGVSSDIIETFGAVSVACAWAMATGALARSHADVAVAVSGVAGPGGGTALKPVGTVVFATAERAGSRAADGELIRFEGATRSEIRLQATATALRLLLPAQPMGASGDTSP